MSVIPISHLSQCDLHVLGNNLAAAASRARCALEGHIRGGGERALAAVNRSLAAHGERVAALYSFSHADGAARRTGA